MHIDNRDREREKRNKRIIDCLLSTLLQLPDAHALKYNLVVDTNHLTLLQSSHD